MRVLRVVLAYEGTAYAGWQVQPGERTVQGVLLEAARGLLGEVRVTGASRTDAGVHALGQVASIRTGSSLAPGAVRAALNTALPEDVRVLACAEAPADFDARRSALGKRYAYLIDNCPVAHPFLRRWAWHVRPPLDVAAMRLGLGALHGRHDFSAFRAAAGRGQRPVCDVRALHVVGAGRGARPTRRGVLAILVSGDRFLHHMVRIIVGSAVQVGRRARPPGWLAEALAGRDRTRAGPTAPAHGLALVRVLYARRVGYPVVAGRPGVPTAPEQPG
jgi:tRNA pseudouridine38-40 synthase